MTNEINLELDAIRLKLASPEEILGWSHGEVLKPETINYRTQRPEKEGLFCEKIFGPTKDWQCYCGKYKRIRYKGIICDKCGVEVTRSIVRRERMGHIKLATPVSHIWFLRGVPSKIGLVLDLSVHKLEKVIYFASYIITQVDESAKETILEQLENEFKTKKKIIKSKYEKKALKIKQESKNQEREEKLIKLYHQREKEIEQLKNALMLAKREVKEIEKYRVISEIEYRNLSLKYGQVFHAETGAQAIRKLLAEIDLEKLATKLETEAELAPTFLKKKIKRRLKLIKGMVQTKIRPEWMILTILPVLPPDLRPMVQLDGGRFAASDLNDLYRRVINRNNRLKRLIELNAPEVICRNEKRMLQEAVDALIDNSARRGKAVAASTGQKRLLKSLADILRGKQGRFRQNLLGKRVDYSGRSVIVIGPHLKLHQCGIPKTMALELFKPFVINQLIEQGYAHNIRVASKLITDQKTEVFDILEKIIQGHYVLLNRAPTLHRLSIQAFQPILIEGKAIQIHPMVCAPFNADFDGDQMAVHIPLTSIARKEAKEIMASTKNLLKPATGDPIITPSQDIVWGCYYMTTIKEGLKGEGKVFSSIQEAILAFESGNLELKARIKVKLPSDQIIETCVGRLYFNEILPEKLRYINQITNKHVLKKIISDCLVIYGHKETVKLIDNIKKLGLDFLTMSGLSWGVDDLKIPSEKNEILKRAEEAIENIRQQYKSGLLTDNERYKRVIETWAKAKDEIGRVCPKTLDRYGSVFTMVDSASRGSWAQIIQMMGMRGLMANPKGETIELPVKNSFKEGLDVLEYFISTHGARKGLSDTALRTANAGYLTRRLIDVVQDIVVYEKDCGDTEGTVVFQTESEEIGKKFFDRIIGRVLLEDIKDPKSGKKILSKGQLIERQHLSFLSLAKINKVRIRSVMNCKAKRGVCQMCYGWDLGYNRLVELGQAVGIVAAQSIGEPGTQLTMRTFHMGGVAGLGDITQGLPRVEELFEARKIKRPALIAEQDGMVDIEEIKGQKILKIIFPSINKDNYGLVKNFKKLKVKEGDFIEENQVIGTDLKGKKVKALRSGNIKIAKDILQIIYSGTEEKKYPVLTNTILWVKKGDRVVRGQQLSEGQLDLYQLYKISGREAVQRYILKEVQKIYTSQGQDVNDKHVEIVIRKMLSLVRIKYSGDTDLLPGQLVEKIELKEICQKAKKEGKKPPLAEELILGISKTALSTESFLSAASFQETARVLIDAAILGKIDYLKGLKENVIIGKLIPCGTGYKD